MGFDDLFSDNISDSDDQHLDMLGSEILVPDQWSNSQLNRHNENIDSIVERNQSVLEAAEHHLRQAQHIRQTVFGHDDAYDEFIAGVENKLLFDTDFQNKYQQLSAIHEEVVAREHTENARYKQLGSRKNSQIHRQKSPAVHAFIPGQPIVQSTEAVVNHRNHILRKDMV